MVPPGRGELEVQYTAPTFIAARQQQFRYKLEGYEPNWIMAGTRRSAFFTNLKPGTYRFIVEACTADGQTSGRADSFEVSLLPFFYQSSWFYLACTGLVAAALAGIYTWRVRLLTVRQRRMQVMQKQLAREVRLRTAELRERTDLLEKEIEERKQAQMEVERVHRKLLEASRVAGMAEVATGVLHNVGNVLNSVNVSTSVLTDRVRKSSVNSVARVVQLLKAHTEDLGSFLTKDPKGIQIPAFLEGLSAKLKREQTESLEELTALHKHVDHIKQIVLMQQEHAKMAGVETTEDAIQLVEDSLRMNESALERHAVALVRDYQPSLPQIVVDRHKVIQILMNLVRNAEYACGAGGGGEKRIVVRVRHQDDQVTISVADNGVGIPRENLDRIFNHGFTTKKNGHGFGLHSGALAAKEMGGKLSVRSEGPGKGAQFTLELPLQPRCSA
jgi:signal transduction histidine kinase